MSLATLKLAGRGILHPVIDANARQLVEEGQSSGLTTASIHE